MAVPSVGADRIITLYGSLCCVVTNWPGVHHHLDENRDNHRLGNIIPLRSDLNSHIIETDRRKWARGISALRPPLDHSSLFAIAKTLFDTGRYIQGYGCSRLGCFLYARTNKFADSNARKTRSSDLTIKFAANALLNLRNISETAGVMEMALDTIKRTIVLIIKSDDEIAKLEVSTKANLALEIGSYFRDYRRLREAKTWIDLALYINRGRHADIEARALQHYGIVLAGSHQSVRAIDMLKRSLDMTDVGKFPFAQTNYLLWLENIHLDQF